MLNKLGLLGNGTGNGKAVRFCIRLANRMPMPPTTTNKVYTTWYNVTQAFYLAVTGTVTGEWR
jgi:hypothetical protein